MPVDRDPGQGAVEGQTDFWPGAIAPDFFVNPPDAPPVTFYERFCGRATVVLFAAQARSIEPFAAMAAGTPMLAVLADATDAAATHSGLPLIEDDGSITRAFLGRDRVERPVAIVLRPTLAIAARVDAPTPAQLAALLQAMPPVTARVCADAAPVLMVPDVLPPALCSRLIAAHDADNFESGMLRERSGRVELVPDPAAKKRRDHRLVDEALTQAVTAALGERLLPVIARAFHYPVTRMEAFKVVAYDAASGGYFRPHRDNVTPDAQHRRFALSVNLNADYAGGELVFPEFGPSLYRPPAGGAAVFSGTLLHAARDVSAGRRYVLLSFMWGDGPA